MRGADALIHGLAAHDVSTLFALSGNQIMPVFDAVFDSDIQLVHTRHEASAVYMAEAYAQLTHGIGVALVTAGGGLGNASGALIAARASDTPVLLLSGDSPVGQDGQGAFQEMDQTGMTGAVSKASRRVISADDMVDCVNWAIDLALSGRPGPVHLALPADVLLAQTTQTATPSVTQDNDFADLDLAAFTAAKQPLVILGPALNATRAPGLAVDLQSALQAPVVTMESPRGINDPALGKLAELAGQADHVLCLGKQVDFTLRFGKLDIWSNASAWDVVLGEDTALNAARQNLGARLKTAALADPMRIACKLAAQGSGQPDRGDWIAHAVEATSKRVQATASTGIHPTDICRVLQHVINGLDNAILISDGGEFGQWAQAGLNAQRRVVNGVSGIIGGGIGYAIGARAADPEATVVALMGDGTTGFHLSEFETAARAGLPFVAVIGNDGRWNAEHMIQLNSFGADRLHGCALSDARYDLAVAALGGFGAHVTSLDQLESAVRDALASSRPACINVQMEGAPAPSF